LAIIGGKLKLNSYWKSPNEGASNSSGFSGFPGGWRLSNGSFENIAETGYWWSATEESVYDAWEFYLYYNNGKVYRAYGYKKHGFSVRCLRDLSRFFIGILPILPFVYLKVGSGRSPKQFFLLFIKLKISRVKF
jgi:hypothetical protein